MSGSEQPVAGIGDNLVGAGRLRSFLDRLENLEDAKQEITLEIKEVYAELKGEGFDPRVMRKIVSLRKQDQAKRDEMRALLELYNHALGLDLV